jgi:hypothetical protein
VVLGELGRAHQAEHDLDLVERSSELSAAKGNSQVLEVLGRVRNPPQHEVGGGGESDGRIDAARPHAIVPVDQELLNLFDRDVLGQRLGA